MNQKQYILTITIPIEAVDDVDARKHANILLDKLINRNTDIETSKKLQAIYDDKPPRGVKLK